MGFEVTTYSSSIGHIPGAVNPVITDVKKSAHILAMEAMEKDEK